MPIIYLCQWRNYRWGDKYLHHHTVSVIGIKFLVLPFHPWPSSYATDINQFWSALFDTLSLLSRKCLGHMFGKPIDNPGLKMTCMQPLKLLLTGRWDTYELLKNSKFPVQPSSDATKIWTKMQRAPTSHVTLSITKPYSICCCVGQGAVQVKFTFYWVMLCSYLLLDSFLHLRSSDHFAPY